MKKLVFFTLFSGFSLYLFPQDSLYKDGYPFLKQAGFRSPLDIPLFLAGNFAEIRPNHFHGGIDMKTESVEGKNVYSVAKGHVSRIKVSTRGYGKVLYIDHPNGYTSVYGHLQKYCGKIEDYVQNQQYRKETFEIELFPSPGELPVESGELVALSGNSGGSSGPHLHFEIRDTKTEWGINPLLFGFDIKDNIPPVIQTLGIYPLSDSSSVNGKKKPVFINPVKANGTYRVPAKLGINVKGPIGFGIEVIDKLNGSGNSCGVFSIDLFCDSDAIYSHDVEKVSFDETRYINSHIDYGLSKSKGRDIQKSFLQPNNRLKIYKNVKNKGVILFNDGLSHEIKYVVKDIYGNTSMLEFTVRSHPFREEIRENSFPEDTLLTNGDLLVSGHDSVPLVETDTDSLEQHYDSLGLSYDSVPARFTFFKYNEYNSFETQDVIISFPKNVLYDNLMFEYSIGTRIKGLVSPVHRIHNPLTPLHSHITVSIKTDSLKKELYSKAIIVSLNGSRANSEGGSYDDGFVTTKTRNLGSFSVMIDTVPPLIKPLSVSGSKEKLVFRISDWLSGIKSYRGTIDDNWILMEYDYKKGLLVYTFDNERVSGGKHSFKLTVTDEKGNSSQYSTNIIR